MNDLNLDLDDEYFDAEELRRRIRAAIDKMDKAQLEVMMSIALVSIDDKNKEMMALLNPQKPARRRRKK